MAWGNNLVTIKIITFDKYHHPSKPINQITQNFESNNRMNDYIAVEWKVIKLSL